MRSRSIGNSLAVYEKALGPDHPDVATGVNNLAGLYQSQGRYADAYPLTRQAIAILEKRGFDPAGQDAAGLASERRLAGVFFRSFLGVASGYLAASPAQSTTTTAESFGAAQFASITSADRAIAQLSARVSAGTPGLSRAVRERQDLIVRRDVVDKTLIQALSRPPADRDPGREQQLRQELVLAEQSLVVLYGGPIFACRHCHQLTYTSTRERCWDRAARRADRLRDRLRWEPGCLNGPGPKPKWMRWRTFDRLVARHDAFLGQSLRELRENWAEAVDRNKRDSSS